MIREILDKIILGAVLLGAVIIILRGLGETEMANGIWEFVTNFFTNVFNG